MFKGFQNKSRLFNGFPNINFQMNTNEAYGFRTASYHFSAEFGTNTQTNLATITSWSDRFGSAYFEQSTAANQPRYVLSSSIFNNYPVIQFQDSARRLNAVGTRAFKISQNSTVVFVVNYDTLNFANCICGPISNSNQYYFFLAGSGTNYTGVGFFDTAFRQNTTESTNPQIIVHTNSEFYINGNLSISANSNIQGTYDQIGCQSSNNNNGLIGNIADIIVYNTKFNSSMVNELSSNINSKYAIY
jgi:hypothetical protein